MARLKIYIDENVDIRIAEGLRKRGVIAFSAIEKEMLGVDDREQFKYASKIQAVIFTHDHHFLEIAKELTKEDRVHYPHQIATYDALTLYCHAKLCPESCHPELVSGSDVVSWIVSASKNAPTGKGKSEVITL